MSQRPSIAIIDPWVTSSFPSGQSSQALAAECASDHDVTVFSLNYEDATGGRARFVRIRAVRWPNFVLLPTFWFAVGIAYVWRRFRGDRYDTVVAVEGFSPVATIRYAHYCHAVHRQHVRPTPGLRGIAQRLAGCIRRTAERVAYRRAQCVVAVSDGLAEDLIHAFPRLEGRVVVIPNFIDVEALTPPRDHDRAGARAALGIRPEGRVLVIVALGHFERKGLPELFAALSEVPSLSLLVVGGLPDRLRQLRAAATRAGIADRVRFVGMVDDVRPFYWAADAFVLPSQYETFSLVAFEAAAAGLPLVATPVHGVREILVDGVTGWEVAAAVDSVREALADVAATEAEDLRARGAKARASVNGFNRAQFQRRWRQVLAEQSRR